MCKKILRKMFASSYYFTIALKHKTGGILSHLSFDAEYVKEANINEWCADPILVDDEEKTYLFYEQVNNGLGSIEVAEVLSDCSISKPTMILGGTHYSYPYVFKDEGKWYMIPESSALSEVCLYSAIQFPVEWRKEQVLLEKAAVDTTVFQKDDNWYMLTFVPSKLSEHVSPEAYRIKDCNLIPLKWSGYDTLHVRGAGKPFWFEGELYRPIQESTVERYGDSVGFAKVEIVADEYHETIVTRLEARNISAQKHYDGLHTYCASNKYEAIDIRCADYHLKNLFLKIYDRIARKR